MGVHGGEGYTGGRGSLGWVLKARLGGRVTALSCCWTMTVGSASTPAWAMTWSCGSWTARSWSSDSGGRANGRRRRRRSPPAATSARWIHRRRPASTRKFGHAKLRHAAAWRRRHRLSDLTRDGEMRETWRSVIVSHEELSDNRRCDLSAFWRCDALPSSLTVPAKSRIHRVNYAHQCCASDSRFYHARLA